MENKLLKFINEQETLLAPLNKSIAINFWKAATTGKKQYFQKYSELEKISVDILSDKRKFRKLEIFYNSIHRLNNPLLKRQLELLYRAFKSKQGNKKLIKNIIVKTSELEQAYNIYRANYKGNKITNNELREILKNTNNSDEAKAAWDATKQIGEIVSEKILDLVRMRNKLAKQLGYPDYYHMSFDLQELNQKQLFQLFARLEILTREPFRKIKKQLDNRLSKEFNIPVAELRPWHYRDPYFQEIPDEPKNSLDVYLKNKNLEKLTKLFYEGIGLNIDDILAKSDLYERAGKDQHAFCIGIDEPYDIRILCNIKPNEQWMGTMLHEFGHGVYDKYIDPKLPYFLRCPAHTLSTEAIALFAGKMVFEPDFLHKIIGLKQNKSKILGNKAANSLYKNILIFTRWCLVMIYFEKELYANPQRDLNKLWWDLVEKYQFLKIPDNRDKPDWSAKIHIATAPVYYHNYLLGELYSSQLYFTMKNKLKSNFKIVNNPEIGLFWVDKLFRHGAIKQWNDGLKEVTGEYLNPKYFIQQYVR